MIQKLFISICLLLLAATAPLKAQTEADSLAIVSAQWEITSTRKGIIQKCAAIPLLFDGPQYISLIEIDPRLARVKAGIAVADSMTQTSRIAKAHNAIAAINGSYFDTKRGNSVCYLRIGKTVVDTTTASELKRVTGAIRVYKGKLSILPWNKQVEKDYKKRRGTVLASGPLMLKDGQVCDWSACEQNFIKTQHPRSAIVTTHEGKVWLLTADGRAPQHAQGMSIPQLTYLIRLLGGSDALNLDGGGSTTLWHTGQVVNHPSDNKRFDHKGERCVPNIVYFSSKK